MNSDRDEIVALLEDVQGWLSTSEGSFLYDQAKRCSGQGVIVEIGSWKGRSTIWLGRGSKLGKNIKVYAIDPHVGSREHNDPGGVWTFPEFQNNVRSASIEELVVPIVKPSHEAALQWEGRPVEFLWIDGAHEYDAVMLDYQSWEPFLMDGGTIAFHDTMLGSAPKKIVNRHLYLGNKFKNIGFVEGITYAEKTANITWMDKIRNLYSLCLRDIYLVLSMVANKIRIPRIMRKLVRRGIEFFQ